MDTPVVVVVVLVAIAGGALLGFLVRGVWASQTMKAAKAEASRIEAEARTRQKELILEGKDEKLRLGREAEEEARARRGELAAQERRLVQRDEQLDQRTEMLEQRDRKLLERERDLDKTKEDLAKATADQVAALERVSGLSAEDAKDILLEAVRAEAEHDDSTSVVELYCSYKLSILSSSGFSFAQSSEPYLSVPLNNRCSR